MSILSKENPSDSIGLSTIIEFRLMSSNKSHMNNGDQDCTSRLQEPDQNQTRTKPGPNNPYQLQPSKPHDCHITPTLSLSLTLTFNPITHILDPENPTPTPHNHSHNYKSNSCELHTPDEKTKR